MHTIDPYLIASIIGTGLVLTIVLILTIAKHAHENPSKTKTYGLYKKYYIAQCCRRYFESPRELDPCPHCGEISTTSDAVIARKVTASTHYPGRMQIRHYMEEKGQNKND